VPSCVLVHVIEVVEVVEVVVVVVKFSSIENADEEQLELVR